MALGMPDSVVIRFPRVIAERLEKEARRLGISIEEHVLELLLRDLDPPRGRRST